MNTIRSVMIVDDSPFDVLLTQKILEKTGRFETIYAATDGAEAIAMFRNYQAARETYAEAFPPLLILLDINMPLMNGFEFLEAFGELDPQTREPAAIVVMLTSSSHHDDRLRALEFDTVKDYVVKPLNKARATELAEQVLSTWS